MNFSLTPNLEQFVRDRAQSGDYSNASDVVREALRLLKKYEEIQVLKLRHLKSTLKQADNDLKRGDFVELDTTEDLDHFFAEL